MLGTVDARGKIGKIRFAERGKDQRCGDPWRLTVMTSNRQTGITAPLSTFS
jgi:hypothetical protein